jgi:hypothetical protein
MSTKPGQLRKYAVELINPIPPNCNDFLEFTRSQINGGRNLISLVNSSNDKQCKIEVLLTCWSCGSNGINNLSNVVQIKYPNSEFIIKRIYGREN